MKKFLAMLLTLALVLSLSAIVAVADAPQSAKFTTTPIYDLGNLADGDFKMNTNDGDNGWLFYPNAADCLALFKVEDGKLAIYDHYSYYLQFRINLPDSSRYDAATCADQDMIGFYFENNTTETCGIAFFGENTTSDGNTHQMSYMTTDFYDIECYLVDLDGNISVANEYLDDYGHGLAEVPAGFKGYYMVTLDTCGSDMCQYGTGFGWHDCPDNGDWVAGECSLTNVGVSIYSTWADIDETFVVDDFFFAKKGANFGVDDGPAPSDDPTDTPSDDPTEIPSDDPTDVPSDDPTDVPSDDPTDVPSDDPTDVPSDDPTDVPSDDPTDVPSDDPTDIPSDDPTDIPSDDPSQPTQTEVPGDPAPTQQPDNPAGDNTTLIIIIAAAVVVVAAAAVIVGIVIKKKSGKAE